MCVENQKHIEQDKLYFMVVKLRRHYLGCRSDFCRLQLWTICACSCVCSMVRSQHNLFLMPCWDILGTYFIDWDSHILRCSVENMQNVKDKTLISRAPHILLLRLYVRRVNLGLAGPNAWRSIIPHGLHREECFLLN